MQLSAKYKMSWNLWPMWVEPKLDGARCMIYVDPVKKTYEAWARSGNDWTKQLEIIGNQLIKAAKNVPGPFVLDGEMWAGSWGETQSLVKSAVADRSTLKFMVFDFLKATVHETGDTTKLVDRYRRLEAFLPKNLKNVERIEHVVVNSHREFLREYDKMLKAGYEGAMLKMPSAGYVNDRSSAWLKHKPIVDVKATVIGIERGDVDGRHTVRMGRMSVRLDASDGGGIHGVGNGFSDRERDEIWKNQKSYIGRRMEVMVQPGDIKFRFPIFKRWLEAE